MVIKTQNAAVTEMAVATTWWPPKLASATPLLFPKLAIWQLTGTNPQEYVVFVVWTRICGIRAGCAWICKVTQQARNDSATAGDPCGILQSFAESIRSLSKNQHAIYDHQTQHEE
eukprot:TRINITY_DN42369_c0_g1_i1.p3 TRINITY_DN42369_c0_g1~~TRINITY_DN42369_c0_g1_i1.p3  ORF type:complete len:115 (+),score=9.20 TRINITY_DN42369_c0_g1_i1:679-1023(+)